MSKVVEGRRRLSKLVEGRRRLSVVVEAFGHLLGTMFNTLLALVEHVVDTMCTLGLLMKNLSTDSLQGVTENSLQGVLVRTPCEVHL